MPKKKKLVADGEVYDAGDGTGYEYRVWLLEEGKVIAEWDSYTETWTGGDHLAKEEAEATIKEIQEDVAAGNAEDWFTIRRTKKHGRN